MNLLVVAGLDPSGGAGLIADVRTAAAHGVRAVGVVTALTEQDTQGVRAANPVDAELLGAQLATLLTDVEVQAVKIGMLGSAAIARVLGEQLALTAAPVVWDPVLAASRGGALYDGDLASAIDALAPHLTLFTPNRGETRGLTNIDVVDAASAREAASAFRLLGIATPILCKGGHGDGPLATDWLVDGDQVTAFEAPRVSVADVHGTGCALATAIASHLAHRRTLTEAVGLAKAWVRARVAAATPQGRGRAAIW